MGDGLRGPETEARLVIFPLFKAGRAPALAGPGLRARRSRLAESRLQGLVRLALAQAARLAFQGYFKSVRRPDQGAIEPDLGPERRSDPN
ncbi:MAG: hypothetical protein LBO66_07805 [Deltaproteobacteria bacterium]|nr:hypothetical protein [Deltaproteobacteria bacterium]